MNQKLVLLLSSIAVCPASLLAQPQPSLPQHPTLEHKTGPVLTTNNDNTLPAGAISLVQLTDIKGVILSDLSNPNHPQTNQVDGATVVCPAELDVAATAVTNFAGPLTFSSYLLAPDGSHKDEVKNLQLTAAPPFPYKMPTHGGIQLKEGGIDQTLTLYVNVTMNGKMYPMQASKHFSVTCKGFKP